MNSYHYKDAIKSSLKSLENATSMDELDKLYKEFRSLYRSDFFQNQAKESEIHKASNKAFTIYKKKRKIYDSSFESGGFDIDMMFIFTLFGAIAISIIIPPVGMLLILLTIFSKFKS